jgi:parallel beta-helix repeat protein
MAPKANWIGGGRTLTSFGQLRALLPTDALSRVDGRTWLLRRPVAVTGRAVLRVRGPGELRIGVGTFLEALRGGTVDLEDLSIVGVGRDGKPLHHPLQGRGFLLADQGRLLLKHDRIADLGSLLDTSFGISFRESLPGSGVIDSSIDENYRGVFTSRAAGVRIVGNQISRSGQYGIDPHTDSTGLVIERNVVTDSGVHGIILAVGVRSSRVVDNVVDGAGDQGIVLFDRSNDNLVEGNQVRRTFDGIVVLDSSGNHISNNTFDPVTRFGLRLSGHSHGNVIEHNTFGHALVGAYAYGGASANSLVGNLFIANAEDLRIRPDAPGNRASPIPPKSEVAP